MSVSASRLRRWCAFTVILTAQAACGGEIEAPVSPLPPCPRVVEHAYLGHVESDGGGATASGEGARATGEATADVPRGAGADIVSEAKTAAPSTQPQHGRVAWKRQARPQSSKCGDRVNPCPLQKWMRLNMAPALAAKDGQALAAALERTATLSPDAAWSWAQMSKDAAGFARTGDIAAARTSCRGCHEAFKKAYRDKYRLRPVP